MISTSGLRRLIYRGQMPVAWIDFVVGVLMGLAWLLPVYFPPYPENYGRTILQSERIIRFICPLLLIFISSRRFSKKLMLDPIIFLILMLYLVMPFISWASFPSDDLLVYGVLPVVGSGLVLLIVATTELERFRTVFIGIGCVAFVLIITSLVEHGVEFTRFYTRNRAHFGFNHPIISGAAIVVSYSFLGLIMSTSRKAASSAWILFAFFTLTALAVILLMAADSRNTLVFFSICILAYSLLRMKNTRVVQSIIVGATIIIPIFFTVFAMFADILLGDALFQKLNVLSSGRLGAMGEMMRHVLLFNQPEFLGPSALARNNMVRGFASADSVFFSYLNLFGVVPALLLFMMMIVVQMRLVAHAGYGEHYRLASSVLVGIMFYFGMDAQGFTVSNSAFFMVFAWCIALAAGAFRKEELGHKV